MTLGFLSSYAYFMKEDIPLLKSRTFGAPMFSDSGAFSARTLGIELSVESYAQWLLKTYSSWEVYANLDVIFDSISTYANQKYLEERGLKPLPVVHYGTSPSQVAKYIEEGHDYIALGGLANRIGADPEVVRQWGKDCFAVADGAAVFHGSDLFGRTYCSICLGILLIAVVGLAESAMGRANYLWMANSLALPIATKHQSPNTRMQSWSMAAT